MKAIRLMVREREEKWEVVGRVHLRELWARFGLPSDKVRRRFPSEARARAFVNEIELAAVYLEAQRQVRATALSEPELRDAEAAVRELPEGASLVEAVRFFVKRGAVAKDGLVQPLCDEFLDSIERVAGARPRTVRNLRLRIEAFFREQGVRRVSQFTAEAIERHLGRQVKGEGISQRTKINDRAALHRFGGWLVRKRAVAANPASMVDPIQEEWKAPAILTPDEAGRLLRAAVADRCRPGESVCFFAVCLFAGLRPEAEFPFLKWSQIHLKGAREERDILVFREKRRGVAQRMVPVEDVLAEWLLLAKKKKWPLKTPQRALFDRVRHEANVTWSGDVMRHSCATYWAAVGRTKRDIAEYLGNSEAVVQARYLNLAKRRREAAARFWALSPRKLGIV